MSKFGSFAGEYDRLLEWTEAQPDPTTQDIESSVSAARINVQVAARTVYDISTEKTGPAVFDKRRNAGLGRGLEFWRVLKRDFGTYFSCVIPTSALPGVALF